MENNISRKNRLIIPKWRGFSITKKLGELESTGNREIHSFENDLKLKKDEWNKKHDFVSAMELLIYKGVEDISVKEAEDYIINSNYNSMLINNPNEKIEDILENKEIYIKISKIRKYLVKYPRDAIMWVDLSLYYTVINQKNKAIKAMKIALQIDCYNRFIIRSAVRLFLHYNEFDYAYYILKNNKLVLYDPWVNATYIAVSQMMNKNIKNIKNSKYLIESNNFSTYSLTELTCSLGNLELINGKEKNAKKLFKRAIISPNDNVAAQLQWISKNLTYIQGIEKIKNKNIKCNFEFSTIERCYNEDFEGAINEVEKWQSDDLISTNPNMVAATLYSSVFGNFEKSEEKIQAGIRKENDNIKLKIQSAYNNINMENFDKAEQILNMIEKEDNKTEDKIFLLADRGMLMYRKGDNKNGEKYYREAIKLAGKEQMMSLKASAVFHLAKEKYRAKDDDVNAAVKEAKELYKYIKDPVILYNVKKFQKEIE